MEKDQHSEAPLIAETYEAVLDESRWNNVADLLARQFDAHQSIIHLPTFSNTPNVVTHGIAQHLHDLYLEILDQDLWLAAMSMLPDRSVCQSEELLPIREMKRSLFFNELCVPANVFHMGGVMLHRRNGLLTGFAIQREEQRGSFEHAERRRLMKLSEHFERAFFVANKLERLQLEVDSLQSSLDRLNAAVMLVNEHGRLVWFNSTADQIIRKGDGIHVVRDGIYAQSTDETMQLQQLLKNTSSTTLHQDTSAGGTLTVSRLSSKSAYQITIAPLPQKGGAWGKHATAVVFVVDPDNPPEMSLDAFKTFYGLTRAESRICAQLLKGQSLKEAADSLHVSIHTARTQMKSILRKCNVTSQIQLVSRLIRSCIAQLE